MLKHLSSRIAILIGGALSAILITGAAPAHAAEPTPAQILAKEQAVAADLEEWVASTPKYECQPVFICSDNRHAFLKASAETPFSDGVVRVSFSDTFTADPYGPTRYDNVSVKGESSTVWTGLHPYYSRKINLRNHFYYNAVSLSGTPPYIAGGSYDLGAAEGGNDTQFKLKQPYSGHLFGNFGIIRVGHQAEACHALADSNPCAIADASALLA